MCVLHDDWTTEHNLVRVIELGHAIEIKLSVSFLIHICAVRHVGTNLVSEYIIVGWDVMCVDRRSFALPARYAFAKSTVSE